MNSTAKARTSGNTTSFPKTHLSSSSGTRRSWTHGGRSPDGRISPTFEWDFDLTGGGSNMWPTHPVYVQLCWCHMVWCFQCKPVFTYLLAYISINPHTYARTFYKWVRHYILCDLTSYSRMFYARMQNTIKLTQINKQVTICLPELLRSTSTYLLRSSFSRVEVSSDRPFSSY